MSNYQQYANHHQREQQQQQQQNVPYKLSNNLNAGDPSPQNQIIDTRLEDFNHRTSSLPSMVPMMPPMIGGVYQQSPQVAFPIMQRQQHDPIVKQQSLIPQIPMQQYPPPHPAYGHDIQRQQQQQHLQQQALYGYYPDEAAFNNIRPPLKKQKTRRKTMVACETCRMKKIRCSNERPSCQSCQSHGYTCVYRDKKENEIASTRDLVTKLVKAKDDPIMDKLDTILNEIAALKNNKQGTKDPGQLVSYVTPISSDSMDQVKEVKRVIQGRWYTAVEYILQWPYFAKYKTPFIVDAINGEDCSPPLCQIDFNEFTDPVRSEKFAKKLIHSLRFFVNSYVNNVHNKAPVIDLGKLYMTVDYICNKKNFECIKKENLDVYYPVAITLLVSALGMMSAPLDGKIKKQFSNSSEQLDQFDLLKKFQKTFNFACFKEMEDNNQYPFNNIFYQLDDCIAQYLKKTCYMYLLKPLEAWKYLNRASSSLVLFLKTHTDLQEDEIQTDESKSKSFSNIPVDERKLIERLYWAIYKEESELRVELSPHISSMPSEILNCPAPSSFPAPVLFDTTKHKNVQISSDESNSDTGEKDLIDTNDCETVREQNDSIWYCYLNETALRKLENRLLEDGFSEEPIKAWSKMLTDDNALNSILLKINYYFDEIANIVDKLHPSLKELMEQTEVDLLQNLASSTEIPPLENHSPRSNENNKKIPIFKIEEALVFTKTRIVTMKLLLSRPIFFYLSMLETKEEMMSFVANPIMAQILSNSFKLANVAQPELLKHRHNGTWFVLRNLYVGCTYILIGVPKLLKFPEIATILQEKGDGSLPSMETMSMFIQEILSVLKYWVDEAPEFHISIDIITKMAKDHGLL